MYTEQVHSKTMSSVQNKLTVGRKNIQALEIIFDKKLMSNAVYEISISLVPILKLYTVYKNLEILKTGNQTRENSQ